MRRRRSSCSYRSDQRLRDLTAPEVDPALGGQDYVILREYVPGAEILIFGANQEPLGIGAGSIIRLLRSVQAREVLYIVQNFGAECEGAEAMQIVVLNAQGVAIGD